MPRISKRGFNQKMAPGAAEKVRHRRAIDRLCKGKLERRATIAIVISAGLALSCSAVIHAQGIQTSTVKAARSSQNANLQRGERDHLPRYFPGGADLPNGWRITPAGKPIATVGDLVTNLIVSPDGRIIVSMNSGFLPNGLDVFDARTHEHLQHIQLTSTWLGMAWSSDGRTLFVAGGNASGRKSKKDPVAPIYSFSYVNGRLSDKPVARFVETIDPKLVWWSGVAYSREKQRLYAVDRGTRTGPGDVVVFDAETRQIVTRIPVEITPYQAVLTPDGKLLFVSNWSSESVSVIDTNSNRVIRTLHVGSNPNDIKLSADGRLFVACANDNSVWVFDTRTLQSIERLSTTLTPLAPEGSTPDALAIDNSRKLLYIANADNNSIAVVNIANRAHSNVIGFIPTGWYPSALALSDHDRFLYIGASRGEGGHPDPMGPHSPLAPQPKPPVNPYKAGEYNIKTLQTSSIELLSLASLRAQLPGWTHQVTENTPYNDSLLSEARPSWEPSIIPRQVGVSTAIQHIIYIIKENRTYDEEFGDLPNANGDPRLAIFGEKITPNQHALAKEYVILDNLYANGQVSVDGHSWSDGAYATDFNEKTWPSEYGKHSLASGRVRAKVPSGGFLWDLAKRKGLTYRSYGEMVSPEGKSKIKADPDESESVSPTKNVILEPDLGAENLAGHFAPGYWHNHIIRDTEKVKVFLSELKQYEANYNDPNPDKRLPNFIVMTMPDDHTLGTSPGAYTPQAMVADNDYAIGELVDAVSHSRYWPSTAIFIIEDDAQDGPDHVDARRTVGLAISPYVKRGIVDSTFYTTSSMIRTMELLLGLPPMSQYDAAATPMYASFGTTPVVTAFNVIKPLININVKNTKDSYGATESGMMDFSSDDHAPMRALNEIIWKSIKGADSSMPLPVHRFRLLIDASESEDTDTDH